MSKISAQLEIFSLHLQWKALDRKKKSVARAGTPNLTFRPIGPGLGWVESDWVAAPNLNSSFVRARVKGPNNGNNGTFWDTWVSFQRKKFQLESVEGENYSFGLTWVKSIGRNGSDQPIAAAAAGDHFSIPLTITNESHQ